MLWWWGVECGVHVCRVCSIAMGGVCTSLYPDRQARVKRDYK